MPINKISPPIYLQTPKNILRIRYTPKVRRMPLIVDVDIPPSSPTTSPPLTACSPSAIASRPTPTVRCPPSLPPLLWEERSAGAETGARGRRHRLRLRQNVYILARMLRYDGLQDVQKSMVLGEGVRCWGKLGAGADGKLGSGRCVGEKGEEVAGDGAVVWKDVLAQ